jgi:hypothetical protein
VTHSDNINELAAALSEARKKFDPIFKSRTARIQTKSGSEYSYKYADLSDLNEATVPYLCEHGLFLYQTPEKNAAGEFVLTTFLMHSSGQWIRSEYPMNGHSAPQEQGSEITYARRYAGSAALSVASEEDDDGTQAQQAVVVKANENPVRVKSVKVDPTRNPNVVRYTITFSDGRKAQTIKQELGDTLKKHERVKEEDRPLILAYIEKGQYGMELMEIKLAPATDKEQAF